jgi:hypothetical protein
MTPQEKLDYFLINNPVGERLIEVIELFYPDWGYNNEVFIAREFENLDITLENGRKVTTRSVNFIADQPNSKNDLDEVFQFNISDTKGELQDLIDQIPLQAQNKMTVRYRMYLCSDLDNVAYGPVLLEVTNVNFKPGSATIEAKSPSLTTDRTGELYTYERFPPQKAFLV